LQAKGHIVAQQKIQKIELETPGIADDRIIRLRSIIAFWNLACLKTSFKKA
jgi:hypothetical protein